MLQCASQMRAREASEKIDFAEAERQISLVRLQRPQSSSKEEGKMKRRKFLKAAGAGVAATGLAGILAAHRAPVFAQANTVNILRWNDFVPGADNALRQ